MKADLSSAYDFADGIFETHVEYPALVAGAHRRRITPLRSPALVRHVALWHPRFTDAPKATASDSSVEDPTATEDRWPRRRCGERLRGLLQRLGLTRRRDHADAADQQQTPELENKIGRAADMAILGLHDALVKDRCKGLTSTTVTLNSRFVRSEPADERFLLFSDIFDGAGNTSKDTEATADSYRAIKLSFEWHHMPVTLSFEVHTETVTLSYVIDASGRLSKEADQAARKDRLFNAVNKALGPEGLTGSARQHRAAYGVLYANVWKRLERDVLCQAKDTLEAIGLRFLDFRGLVIGAQKGQTPIIPPFSRGNDQDDIAELERPSECGRKGFSKILPFLQDTLAEGAELTVSRFFVDRAFYASALGQQPMPMLDRSSQPLCYVIYEDTLNKWQLGRMVYRLHRAGTARISATMHFTDLLAVDRRLQDVEIRLQGALNQTIASEKLEAEEAERARDELAVHCNAVDSAIKEVDTLFKAEAIDYRVERSRYYVSQFRRVSKALRIKRVEGFQPYDEFVEQRLGPVFEFIDRLGKRYARVQEQRDFLRGKRQQLDSFVEQKSISDAQIAADLALGILVPYYLAHTIIGILELEEYPGLVWLVWIFVFSGGACWVAGKFLIRNVTKWKRGFRFSWPVRSLFFFGSIGLFVVALSLGDHRHRAASGQASDEQTPPASEKSPSPRPPAPPA